MGFFGIFLMKAASSYYCCYKTQKMTICLAKCSETQVEMTWVAHDSSGGPGHTDNRLRHCHPHVILLFTAFKSFIARCPLQSLFICRRHFPDGHPHQASTLSFPPQMEYFDTCLLIWSHCLLGHAFILIMLSFNV